VDGGGEGLITPAPNTARNEGGPRPRYWPD